MDVAKERQRVVNRPIILTLVMVTLFGALSGFFATLIKPVHYQADAYVVVYDMPRGLNDILSPDEAAHLDEVYRAGVLQDAVVKQVQATLPEYSASDLARSIQVEIVAYTPFTRITATATTAEGAAQLANVVADAWTSVAGEANQKGYDATKATLEARENDLLKKIANVQRALAAADPSSTTAAELRSELKTLQNDLGNAAAAIVDLDKARYDVVGNAYVSIPAKASNATKSPSLIKNLGVGAGIGFSLGLLLALWLTLRRWRRLDTHSRPQGMASSSLAVGREATHGW